MDRRLQTLASLLLAAGLLLALPGTLAGLRERGQSRLSERLTPPEARTFTVWVVRDATASLPAIKRLCAAFEKANAGVRVFLRQADASELTAKDAALPDVVLFSPCELREPEQYLLPLIGLHCREDALTAGRSQMLQYAVPLWVAPGVLSVPAAWCESAARAPAPTSRFSLLPAVTPEAPEETPEPPGVPWARLCEKGAIQAPEGLGWQQLLLAAPAEHRARLTAALTAGGAPDKPCARVTTLSAFRAALSAGEALQGFALPALTHDVLLLGACRDGALSERFLALALSEETQASLSAYALVGVAEGADQGWQDALGGEIAKAYARSMLLPNAFTYAREELYALCEGDFGRGVDPVETALRLR